MSTKFDQIADKLRAHDAAQRQQLADLKAVILQNRAVLRELANFFLDDGAARVHAQIQSQIRQCDAALKE